MFAGLAVLLAAAVAAAVVSYRFVERPFLERKRVPTTEPVPASELSLSGRAA